MPKVQYGNTSIEYKISVEPDLKNSYIQVEQACPILYRTPVEVDETVSNKAVLKKARWVIQKLRLVAEPANNIIQTGSRIPYLGKRYYAVVSSLDKNKVDFKGSGFIIQAASNTQEDIENNLEAFYKSKCEEKIRPRFKRWISLTSLSPTDIKFRRLDKRWGSCTKDNHIIISIEAIKLPWKLIDYLILHELCHIEHKGHTKGFWKLVETYMPDYEQRDQEMDLFEF